MRIALCFYGQPRTAEYCFPYIEKFYKSAYDIDAFCSVKPYNFGVFDGQTNIKQPVSSETLELIKTTLLPKQISVMKDDTDTTINIDNWKVFNSAIASVMLKQEYAKNNNVSYDLTILQRYDSIIIPNNSLSTLLDHIIPISTSDALRKRNLLFHFGMRQNNFSAYKEIQDLWLVASNNAMEILFAEYMNYARDAVKQKNDHSFPPFKDENPHTLICRLAGLSNTSLIEIQKMSMDGMHIEPIVVRNGEFISENKSIFDRETWAEIKKYWIETQWSTFYRNVQ